MNRLYYYTLGKGTDAQRKALIKAESELKKEMYRQIDIVSGCAGIALYENWDWRKGRISKLFQEITETWDECAKDKDLSIIEMCENETGLVITAPGFEGNYKDLKYFQKDGGDLSILEMIHMRHQQKKWAGAMLFASAIIALHRLHGFGGERVMRLKGQIEEVRDRYDWNPHKIVNACDQITGVSITLK